MIIKDLGELTKFLKLCRKHGVKDIKYGDCNVTFGDLPRMEDPEGGDAEVPTDGLTPEQLVFLSADGM